MTEYLGEGYKLWVDNWYSSPELTDCIKIKLIAVELQETLVKEYQFLGDIEVKHINGCEITWQVKGIHAYKNEIKRISQSDPRLNEQKIRPD